MLFCINGEFLAVFYGYGTFGLLCYLSIRTFEVCFLIQNGDYRTIFAQFFYSKKSFRLFGRTGGNFLSGDWFCEIPCGRKHFNLGEFIKNYIPFTDRKFKTVLFIVFRT